MLVSPGLVLGCPADTWTQFFYGSHPTWEPQSLIPLNAFEDKQIVARGAMLYQNLGE